MPKVSVLVPVYGVEKYIERCTRSLFEQTLDDIEFIFVDDCTPDRSIEILKSVIEKLRLRFAEKKYNVRIVRMPTNSGLAAVRRHGIQLATGDYIIHCDSDDWVDVTMYEKMYNKAIEEEADMVVCDYIITDGLSSQKYVKACHSVKPFEFLENMLFQRDPWSLWNKLFKKTAYYKIVYPDNSMGEDMATSIQLITRCRYIAYIPEPLYKYYFNPESITKTNTFASCVKKYHQLFENSKIVLGFLEDTGLNIYMKDAIIVYKHFIRTVLYPIVYKQDYYTIWRSTFPGLNWQCLISSHISVKYKIQIILTILHLYPRKKYLAK